MTEIQSFRFVMSVLFGRRQKIKTPDWLIV